MKKINNKKGFTLIELLAVIVILAILVAVAVPAVTRYLNQARRGSFVNDAATMIEAVRNDYLTTMSGGDKTYNKEAINKLLEKKLNKSPFGNAYTEDSRVLVKVTASTGEIVYKACLSDGTYTIKGEEKAIIEENIGSASSNECASYTG